MVLIGGSYIGCEVAASLTAKGTECAIVMMEDVALSRTFGEEVGRCFHELLASNGVEILGGEELDGVRGRRATSRRVRHRRAGARSRATRSWSAPACSPDVMLAERGRARGRRRDRLRRDAETSVEGIFAAGDVCSYDSVVHGRRLRVEHWDVALQQGRHAARAMIGEEEPYRDGARTSSATSPTGRASSTSGRRPSGTRWSGAATATRASSPPGTSRTGRSRGRSPWTARRTWSTPGRCSRRASTSSGADGGPGGR